MPTSTLTLPAPPKVLSGREIYDSIMSQIEPDLVSSVLSTLKEKYANETPEQKEARRIRYNDAFVRYYEMYQTYLEDMHARIQRYHRDAMRSLEGQNRSEEEKQLDDIAAQFFALPS